MLVSRFSLRSAATAAVALCGAAFLATAAPQAARAQGANLVFTGGNNTPLTLALLNPVTYTITTSVANEAPLFVFQGAGSTTDFSAFGSGTITYTVNGSTSTTFNFAISNFSGGTVTTNDFGIASVGTNRNFAAGDIVTLSSGTLTTTLPVTGTPPQSTNYTTFMTSGSGTRISNIVGGSVGAPEPGTLPLIGMGLVTGAGSIGMVRRRRKAKRTTSNAR